MEIDKPVPCHSGAWGIVTGSGVMGWVKCWYILVRSQITLSLRLSVHSIV